MDDIIKICKNCYQPEPCNCNNKEYISVLRWIYDLMKQLNPMG